MSRLLIQEPPLQVLPSLADEVGLNEAIILQQIHYWTQNSRNVEPDAGGIERTWVFKSHDEWEAEFPFWSRSTIRRAVKSLRDQGLIIAEQKRQHEGDNRNWYAIRRENLPGSGEAQQGGSVQNGQKGSVQNDQGFCSKRTEGVVKMNRSAPAHNAPARDKNTTENTTETPSQRAGAPACDVDAYDDLRNHPAVEAHREIFPETRRRRRQREKIASTVDDLDLWRQVLDYWSMNGYRARSIGKQLSAYRERRTDNDERDRSGSSTNRHSKQNPGAAFERISRVIDAASDRD